jgi:hypothetical protein
MKPNDVVLNVEFNSDEVLVPIEQGAKLTINLRAGVWSLQGKNVDGQQCLHVKRESEPLDRFNQITTNQAGS